MRKEKQIEEKHELSKRIYMGGYGLLRKDCDDIAEQLCDWGYRKQIEGEWVDNHCTKCGMTPICEETWTDQGLTPPRFELFMSFCPCCGAKMKGE